MENILDNMDEEKTLSINISPTIVCGPSGVGKGTLLQKVKELLPNTFGVAVSHTTRTPRQGEEDGIAYNFTTNEEFKKGIENGSFVEYSNHNTYYYGTSIQSINNISNENLICILEIDVSGAETIKNSSKLKNAKYLFITCDGKLDTLKQRLISRNTETDEQIKIRLNKAEKEFTFLNKNNKFFDCIISNDNLDESAFKLAQQFKTWYPFINENNIENNIENSPEIELATLRVLNTTRTELLGTNPNDVTGRSVFTPEGTKLAVWMSMDLHLVDISLAVEHFEINVWMDVFFHDPNKYFTRHIDPETFEEIKKKGYISYDALAVSTRKKLPLKKSFLLNASQFDLRKSYLELYNADENIWKQYFRFNAICAEHMELFSFPFDAQFLNLQMSYRVQDYYFLNDCPEWINGNINDKRWSQYSTDKPIKLTVKDTIKTEWNIEKPWIDLRLKRGNKFDFHFSVIRLRVVRNPIYYLINAVLPIFLVLSCSFASFVMPIDEYLGDKLAYIITLLLTLTAFQYSINEALPKSTEITMIDSYILYGYFILTFFTLEISIVWILYEREYENAAHFVDYITAILFAVIWLWRSGRFLIRYLKGKSENNVNWEKVSESEMESWTNDTKDGSGSSKIGVEKGRFFGTNCTVECNEYCEHIEEIVGRTGNAETFNSL